MRVEGRHVTVAVAAALATVAISVIPTDVVGTPWFTRTIPVRWWELPVALTSGALVGVWVLLGRGRSERGGRSVVGAVVLGVLSIGCPTCNKLVVLALGTSGALGVWASWQPLLGVVSLVLLALAVAVKARTRSCPVSANDP